MINGSNDRISLYIHCPTLATSGRQICLREGSGWGGEGVGQMANKAHTTNTLTASDMPTSSP